MAQIIDIVNHRTSFRTGTFPHSEAAERFLRSRCDYEIREYPGEIRFTGNTQGQSPWLVVLTLVKSQKV